MNGPNGGVGASGRPPSDADSNESSFFEEENDELEADLDKPWEKPSIARAKKAGKVGRRAICQSCTSIALKSALKRRPKG